MFERYDPSKYDDLPSHTSSPSNDLGKITQPHHYRGKYEAVDVVEDLVRDLPPKTAMRMFSALKYLFRWNYKNKEEDLLKAMWWISRELTARGRGDDVIETVKAAVGRAKQTCEDEEGS